MNEEILHDFNMGYVVPDELGPHSSIAFYPAENEYFHPWSIEHIGFQYGYGKLKEIITLNDYLTLPAHLVNGLVKGIVDGEKKRFADNPPKAEDGLSSLSPEDRKIFDAMIAEHRKNPK